ISAVDGSSCAAFFWVTRRICLSSFITSSSARIDFSRPTKSGTIMCGNTTMSRSGSTGKAWLAPGVSGGRGLGAFIRPYLSSVPEEVYSPKGNGALQVEFLENPAGIVGRPLGGDAPWECQGAE